MRIVYPKKSKSIDFKEVSVCRAWLMFSNATSVNWLKLPMIKIRFTRTPYKGNPENSRLIFSRKVRAPRV